jgi:hypothetical protein
VLKQHLFEQSIYKEACSNRIFCPGPYGDVLTCIARKVDEEAAQVIVTGLFQKAYPKPAFEARVCLLAQGYDESFKRDYRLITKKISQSTGKSMSSFHGDVLKLHHDQIEAPMYVAIKRALSQLNLRASFINLESIKYNYDESSLFGQVQLDGVLYPCSVRHFKTIPTSQLTIEAGGEALADGSRRVHLCSSYLFEIEMGSFLSHLDDHSLKDAKVLNFRELVNVEEGLIDESFESFLAKEPFFEDHHGTIFKDLVKSLRLKKLEDTQVKTKTLWEKLRSCFCLSL